MTVVPRAPLRRAPLPRAEQPGRRSALVGPDGERLSHADLRALVDDLARRLPDADAGRCLVHVPLSRDVDSVAAYLAVLEAGHVALIAPDGDDGASARILERYPPDLRVASDGRGYDEVAQVPQHLLHPDLAVLLSTSGSTGSPKLVRLSHANLLSNAVAIAEALRLTAEDRGITSLPLHHCYGLSVLHSHLHAGASVVLTDASVLEDAFWGRVERHRVTTVAAVPHTLALMATGGALDRPHPSLRLVTQAGGRMEPGAVAATALLGVERGWDLAVMYGQTEATARIAVMDPTDALDNPDAVGRPVAGTRVRLDLTAAGADPSTGLGELVVAGPGVMMGYALHPDDLACGPMLDELRTGDLARVDERGLIRVAGRISSFVKVMGVRVDLGSVEAALAAGGFTACVTGDDSGLRVAVEGPPDDADGAGSPHADEHARRARALAGRACGLGVSAVEVAVLDLPRRSSGKIDRGRCDALVRRVAASTRSADDATSAATSTAAQVARRLGTVLGRTDVDLDLSFVELGGDSLSHVRAGAALSGVLGDLPRDWHHRPLRILVDGTAAPLQRGRLARAAAALRLRSVETSVLLRAAAVVAICVTHADLFRVKGGAHVLLAIAGYNAARFGLSRSSASARWVSTARILVGVAVPTALTALLGTLLLGRYAWPNVFLVNWLSPGATEGVRDELWFVEALVASLVLVTALLALPPLARWWRTDPWRVAAVLAMLALVPRFVTPAADVGVIRGTLPMVFWIFALGIALGCAATRPRRWTTVAVALAGGVAFFPEDPVRNASVLVGVALLALVPSVRLPAWTLPVVTLLASASLYVYLAQFPIIRASQDPVVAVVVSLVVGCLLWRLAHPAVARLQALLLLPRS